MQARMQKQKKQEQKQQKPEPTKMDFYLGGCEFGGDTGRNAARGGGAQNDRMRETEMSERGGVCVSIGGVGRDTLGGKTAVEDQCGDKLEMGPSCSRIGLRGGWGLVLVW
jgi:hypothetical protein